MSKLKISFKVGPKGAEQSFNAVSVLAYTKEDFAKRAEKCGWKNPDAIYAAAEKAKAAYEAKNSTKVTVEPHVKPEPKTETKTKEKEGK